ncbi:3547_t:CDS:1, partial [Cetraspora pellucida]
TENITTHILLKIYEKDFKKLVDKTKTIKDQEELNLFTLYKTFTETQVQERKYVRL